MTSNSFPAELWAELQSIDETKLFKEKQPRLDGYLNPNMWELLTMYMTETNVCDVEQNLRIDFCRQGKINQ